MMKRKRILLRSLLSCLLAFLLPLSAQGSDQGREKELATAIADSLVIGERVTLEVNGGSFLAIYSEPEGKQNRGMVILLHGLGSSPVQSDVIEPLRIGLPMRGWGTLSLQMPILEADAERMDYYRLIPEAIGRIKAGVRFLKEKEPENITLVGHNMGAIMGLSYLASDTETAVSAAAMIGLFIPLNDQADVNMVEALSKINRPLLDFYGSRDLPIVIQSAKKRRAVAVKNSFYQQIQIDSANHFFRGLDSLLLGRISGWLNRVTETTEIVPTTQINKEKK
jgi:pimeloyl-ACP methyl ester carboxylesterase